MMKFHSPHRDLAEFATVYADTAQKSSQFVERISQFILIGLVSLILVSGVYFIYQYHTTIGLAQIFQVQSALDIGLYGFAFLSVAYGLLGYFFHVVRQRYKRLILPIFHEILGWRYDPQPTFSLDLNPFRCFGLLPHRFNRVERKFLLSGRIKDVSFVTNDVVLKQTGSDSKTKTVFRGTIVAFQFPHVFKATTIVLKDKGWRNKKRLKQKNAALLKPSAALTRREFQRIMSADGSAERAVSGAAQDQDLDRVDLALQGFEEKFEAYSSDQVEARVLMSPDFVEALIALEYSVRGRGLRFGFHQNKLFIAFDEPSIFDPRTYFSRLSHRAYAQSILDEVSALMSIVHLVRKKRNSFDRSAQNANVDNPLGLAAHVRLQDVFNAISIRET